MEKYNESFDFTEALKPGGALYWSANTRGIVDGIILPNKKDGGGNDEENRGEKGTDVSINNNVSNNFRTNDNTKISTTVYSNNANVSNNQNGDNRDKEDNKMKGVDKVRQTDSRAVSHNGSTFSTSNAFTFRSIERNQINTEEYRYALISKNII